MSGGSWTGGHQKLTVRVTSNPSNGHDVMEDINNYNSLAKTCKESRGAQICCLIFVAANIISDSDGGDMLPIYDYYYHVFMPICSCITYKYVKCDVSCVDGLSFLNPILTLNSLHSINRIKA